MKAWHLLASLSAHAVVIGAAAVLCLSFSEPDEIVIPISVELVEESQPSSSGSDTSAETAKNHEPENPEPREPPPVEQKVEKAVVLTAGVPIEEQTEPPGEPVQKTLPDAAKNEEISEVEEKSELHEDYMTSSLEQAKVVSGPVALNRIVPVYPRLARRKGHEGSVVVEVSVTPDGAVGDADVISSSGHKELDEAAVGAVLKAKFSPATENGARVEGLVRLTFNFRLEM